MFEKSRSDGSFGRAEFIYDHEADSYTCPGGKPLRRYWQEGRAAKAKPPADGIDKYRARKADSDACALRDRCRPGDAGRKVLRSIHEGARDLARDLSLTDAYLTSRRERKRLKCCSRTSSASLNSTACASEAPTEQKTSFTSPPPPRIYARWPSSSRCRHRRWQGEAERLHSLAILNPTAPS